MSDPISSEWAELTIIRCEQSKVLSSWEIRGRRNNPRDPGTLLMMCGGVISSVLNLPVLNFPSVLNLLNLL